MIQEVRGNGGNDSNASNDSNANNDDAKIHEILAQAPDGLSLDDVKAIFKKHDKQVLPTLMELWDIQEQQKKPKSKWDDIRETCDAFDMEMERAFMSKLRASAQNM